MNEFVKSHGLGNSYIILEEAKINFELTPEKICQICSVDFGIGSDGILLKVPSTSADFGVRIFNPDGSEAEKSGNGVRIFGKYLYDRNYVTQKSFTLETLGGLVTIDVLEEIDGKANMLKAGMGKALFRTSLIPALFPTEEVIDQKLIIGGKTFRVNSVSMGNPHCVIFVDKLNAEEIKKFGPQLEINPAFPQKVNVQFARVISKNEVEILIWERGAGYTLASGSSSCAVVAIGHKTGRLGSNVQVKMPGGRLWVDIHADWNIDLTGPVEEVCFGTLL